MRNGLKRIDQICFHSRIPRSTIGVDENLSTGGFGRRALKEEMWGPPSRLSNSTKPRMVAWSRILRFTVPPFRCACSK